MVMVTVKSQSGGLDAKQWLVVSMGRTVAFARFEFGAEAINLCFNRIVVATFFACVAKMVSFVDYHVTGNFKGFLRPFLPV